MREASQLFSDEQKERIRDAVAAAEEKTSAEILPVVATSSGRYDRAEDVVGLWTGAAAVIAVWLVFRPLRPEAGSWDFQIGGLELPALLLALVGGFVVGAALASRVMGLRRLFSPRRQMRAEVWARARALFHDCRVHRTAGGTGLLIYVSLFERHAAVLGDVTVTEALGQEALDTLCGELVAALRRGDPMAAFCGTIRSAGERLGEVLPRADDDEDELPNALVCIDGL